jgi:two-component system response regulator HydG
MSDVDGVKKVLLVNADEAFRQVLQQVLGAGYVLSHIPLPQQATAHLGRDETDIVLLNLGTQNENAKLDGARLFLQEASAQSGAAPVIAYGWDHQRRGAVDALRHGAVDFLEQPLDVRELKFALDGACRRADLARDLAAAQKFSASHIEGLLGNSKAMERVHEVIHKVAGVFTSVLITGESGTGKGMVARAIHRLSSRANKPFVESSLCTLAESLIEDELFGHEKGAFTGATQSRRGRFEEADGGTIFLDEIGDLALPLQAKLLRVLQERTVERLGSNVPHPVDVRVVCATNRNLEKMVQEGTFREDLYFRISVVRLHLPQLRERGEDIPLLAEYFLRVFAKAHKKPQRGLTPGFLNALAQHKWPGNVRELQNVIERSLVLANGNEHLGVHDLPPELRTLAVPDEVSEGSFHAGVRSFKRELVRSALRMHMGNKLKAARELGISRCYLHRLLNQLNIENAAPESEREGLTERAVTARDHGDEYGHMRVRVV